MMLTAFLALAVTLPMGLVGVAAGCLGERLGADATLRARLWATAFFATAGAALAVVLLDPVIVGFSSSMTFQADDPAVLERNVETFRETHAGGAAQIVYAIQESPRSLPIGLAILTVIGFGALCGAAVYGLRLARLFRIAAGSTQLPDAQVAARCGIDPSMIRLADCAAPVLAGFHRPLILVPKVLAGLGLDQLTLICRHELSHFRRRDNLRSLIETMLRLPLWFNPALWFIRRRLIAVREELADADVTAGAPAAERRAYAETLVMALRHCGSTAKANAFTGAEARRRIQAIMRPTGRSGWAVSLAVSVLVVVLALVAETSAIAAASRPQALIAPRIVAKLTDALGPSAAAIDWNAAWGLDEIVTPAPETQAPSADGAGPIDYARPPGVRAEELIQMVCTLTEEGKASGCAAPEPERDPVRVARAIDEIETRGWKLGEIVEPLAEDRGGVAYKARATTVRPGPITFWLAPDGKVTGGPVAATRLIPADPAIERRIEEGMRAVMIRAEEAARQARRGPGPAEMQDEDGKVIARHVAIETPGGRPGAPAMRWRFAQPAQLKLNGRAAGALYTDDQGRLTFNGRREITRDMPVPVRDENGVVRLRANIGALQPGEKAMFPFAPVLEAAPAAGKATMKLTTNHRPQAPATAAVQPAAYQQPDWPSGRAAPRQGPIYDAVDFLFAVDLGEGARWKTEVRVKRGEPAKAVRLPAPPDFERGPLNYLVELTDKGEPRLHMMRADGRPIDGAVSILRLDGNTGLIARSEAPRPYTIEYAARPVGQPVNAATAWMPGEMLTFNAAGAVVHREPCQIPPGQAAPAQGPGRCRPLPAIGRFPIGFRLQ